MASYNSAPPVAHRPVFGAGPVPMADPAAPAGTFAPGTKIQVGSQKVIIQKYFSEGGFAHVYLVKMPKPIDGTDIAVLKRVAVPDKEHLANMRTEVETMKKLKGHRAIVTYYDSHASQLKGGGYEVFLLMEFCNGGGLIDFMNTRLQNRLTEPEILKTFSDVAEGVASMHYLKPPLLHRDLKVENVLITSTSTSKRFKLCDFGSTAPPRPAAATAAECRLIEDDIQKHTTLQYRSPEMIDVYRKQPIDEKSDVWALGVLLYKLCYYTTPFEAQGQLAILNASFKFPAYPVFSDPLKKLIASMLKENPKSRPNIYQVLREACMMQGIETPVKDIYTGRTQSESRRNQQLPSPPDSSISSPPTVGAVFSPPTQQKQVIPEVIPMRRGRPTTTSQPHVAKPSPSPMRGAASDPWAALDSKSATATVDEISSRFPSLDQFSLLHDGGKFDFAANSPPKPAPTRDLNQRVAEKLADDAFAVPVQKQPPPMHTMQPLSSGVSKAQMIISNNPEMQPPPPVVYEPTPTRPINNAYVSQGTMTSPTPPPAGQSIKYSSSPIQRFPPTNHNRSSSLPRTGDTTPNRSPWLRPQAFEQQPNLPPRHTSTNLKPGHARNISSSRPSLEGGRPSQEALDPISRVRSSSSRPRPTSTYLESNLDFLREKESSGRSSSSEKRSSAYTREMNPGELSSEEDTTIASNVEYLRSLEETDSSKKDHHHHLHHHRHRSSGSGSKSKRSSLPSMSLSGTKSLLAGKFGDAFKRFEHNAPPTPRTPSPRQDLNRRDLTPIAGSEATDGRSDDGRGEDMDNLPPEQRRELERRRLSMEERRVADAAAEYRRRVAERGPPPRSIGGVTRASSIQNKVKSLLSESNQSPPTSPKKPAGRFIDDAIPSQASAFRSQMPSQGQVYSKPPQPPRKLAGPGGSVSGGGVIHARTVPLQHHQQQEIDYSKPRSQQHQQQQQQQPLLPAAVSKTGGARPSAPPKPTHLNSLSTGPQRAASGNPSANIYSDEHPPPPPPKNVSNVRVQPRPDMSAQEREDYVADFSRRFPSLSGIEMVEREIDGVDSQGLRGREA